MELFTNAFSTSQEFHNVFSFSLSFSFFLSFLFISFSLILTKERTYFLKGACKKRGKTNNLPFLEISENKTVYAENGRGRMDFLFQKSIFYSLPLFLHLRFFFFFFISFSPSFPSPTLSLFIFLRVCLFACLMGEKL